ERADVGDAACAWGDLFAAPQPECEAGEREGQGSIGFYRRQSDPDVLQYRDVEHPAQNSETAYQGSDDGSPTRAGFERLSDMRGLLFLREGIALGGHTAPLVARRIGDRFFWDGTTASGHIFPLEQAISCYSLPNLLDGGD